MFDNLIHKKNIKVLLVGSGEEAWTFLKIFEETLKRIKIELVGIITYLNAPDALEKYVKFKHLPIFSFENVPEDLEVDLIIDLIGTEEVAAFSQKIKAPVLNHLAAYLFYNIIEELRNKIKLQKQFDYNERIAMITALANSLADTIRNPITAIGGFAKSILEDCEPSLPFPIVKKVNIILEEVKKLEMVLKEITLLGKPPVLRKKIGNINEIIKKVCEEFAPLFDKHGVEIVKKLEPEMVKMSFDVELLKKSLEYVFKAAIGSMPEGGVLTVNTQLCWDSVLISITDTGKGLEQWQIENILQPLSSWQKEVELYLIMARKIIEAHAGKFTVYSKPNEGTKIIIELSIETPPPAPPV
ncbi:MAG: ATP-binding protein [Candidatus Desulfofervidaceae bacterium]|nr:ATP-binding protein [Candidatus Desulfofervidaceae bacterium]